MRARVVRAALSVTCAGALLSGCGLFTQPMAGPPPGEPQHLLAANAQREALDQQVTAASLAPKRVRVDIWVDDVCSGMERFGASFAQAKTERREGLYSTPHKAKKAMLAYIDAVDAALDTAIAATAAWGVPDTSDGERMVKRVRSALEYAQQTNYKYRPQIAMLHSTDSRFTPLARSLLMESEADLSAAMLRLDWFEAGGAFKTAFNNSRACKAL